MTATPAAIQKDIQEVIPKRILFVFYKPNYTGGVNNTDGGPISEKPNSTDYLKKRVLWPNRWV